LLVPIIRFLLPLFVRISLTGFLNPFQSSHTPHLGVAIANWIFMGRVP
jgi:hypothetical protein